MSTGHRDRLFGRIPSLERKRTLGINFCLSCSSIRKLERVTGRKVL